MSWAVVSVSASGLAVHVRILALQKKNKPKLWKLYESNIQHHVSGNILEPSIKETKFDRTVYKYVLGHGQKKNSVHHAKPCKLSSWNSSLHPFANAVAFHACMSPCAIAQAQVISWPHAPMRACSGAWCYHVAMCKALTNLNRFCTCYYLCTAPASAPAPAASTIPPSATTTAATATPKPTPTPTATTTTTTAAAAAAAATTTTAATLLLCYFVLCYYDYCYCCYCCCCYYYDDDYSTFAIIVTLYHPVMNSIGLSLWALQRQIRRLNLQCVCV